MSFKIEKNQKVISILKKNNPRNLGPQYHNAEVEPTSDHRLTSDQSAPDYFIIKPTAEIINPFQKFLFWPIKYPLGYI